MRSTYLTGGGPGSATEVISLYVEKVFFSQFRMGYASFLALVTALMVSVFVIFYQTVVVPRTKGSEA